MSKAPTSTPESAESKSNSKRKRKPIIVPAFNDANELMGIVHAHRSNTVQDTSRQFTNGGFKAAGGIDSLPLNTRGMMAASLILSIATEAQDETSDANRVLGFVTEFAGSAQNQAKDAAMLQSFENIAKIDGLPPRSDDETIEDFKNRILTHATSLQK